MIQQRVSSTLDAGNPSFLTLKEGVAVHPFWECGYPFVKPYIYPQVGYVCIILARELLRGRWAMGSMVVASPDNG